MKTIIATYSNTDITKKELEVAEKLVLSGKTNTWYGGKYLSVIKGTPVCENWEYIVSITTNTLNILNQRITKQIKFVVKTNLKNN